MPDQTDNLPKIEPITADQNQYVVRSRLEVAAVLGTLRKAGSMVTGYFKGGNDFILTSILAVRPEQDEVVIEFGADAAANRRALEARTITFVATLAHVKVQFVAESLRQSRFDGGDVMSMAMPASLLRLQRREYFRIATPLTRPLVCSIAPQAAPVIAPDQVTIVDISCGGISVIDPGVPAAMVTGVCLRGCRIPLPELGAVETDILVKTVFEVTLRNGSKQKHAGCAFVNMRERDRSLIQRYISRLERERRDRVGSR